jgi:hypothetical protein
VPVRPEDALDVVRVIELALRSGRERRTIDVDLAGTIPASETMY